MSHLRPAVLAFSGKGVLAFLFQVQLWGWSGPGTCRFEFDRVLAGADDLIQLIGRKVIAGKNITT